VISAIDLGLSLSFHTYWLPPGQQLSRLPSECFSLNVYLTFQDDRTAFRQADDMNWRRLMWANDFPTATRPGRGRRTCWPSTPPGCGPSSGRPSPRAPWLTSTASTGLD
jgi:hypothetical protein